MRILLYEWNSIGKQDLQDALVRLGHKVDVIPYKFHDFFGDEAFENKMKELLMISSYDFFISFNFFPILSKVCNEFHLKYIAWVWDSPLIFQFFNTVHLPWNYIFIFDKGLYLELKKLGVNTVYHMPLAVNVNRLDSLMVTEEDTFNYNHDVSFVGNLYENRNHFDKIPYLPDYLKGYFDSMMKAQMKIHGYNFIEEMLTEDIMNEFSKYATVKRSNDYIGSMKSLVADLFFNAKITELERKSLLELLSKHFHFTLYTDSKEVNLPKAEVFGYADYYTIMPKIFRYSKINLNITLRTIRTGIPLRIFDILGAGGFLITNYQSELSDCFELDRDLVCYESEEDLINKVDYYLKHENERKQIALNGYEKVKKNHTYEITLQKIIETVFPKYNINYSELETEVKSNTSNMDLLCEKKEQIQKLIFEKHIEEAGMKYFEECRKNELFSASPELRYFDDLFNIYTYEKLLGLKTFLDISDNLDEIQEIIRYMVSLLQIIEKYCTDSEKREKSLEKNTADEYINEILLLEKTSEPITEQALEQMIEQTSEQKIEQTSEQKVEQTSEQKVEQTSEQKMEQASEQFLKQTDKYLIVKNSGELPKLASDTTNIQLLKEKKLELLRFVIDKQVSYYAIEYLIQKYSFNKIRMLNVIARLFHKNNQETYVIPFLMKANEFDESDNETLYNITNILLDWKEYDMAMEYAEKISEDSERVKKLFKQINELKNKLKI